MKAVEIAQNKVGKRYAILRAREGSGYVVWAESINYSAGRNVARWGFVTPKARMPHTEAQAYARNGISLDAARSLLAKKAGGEAR